MEKKRELGKRGLKGQTSIVDYMAQSESGNNHIEQSDQSVGNSLASVNESQSSSVGQVVDINTLSQQLLQVVNRVQHLERSLKSRDERIASNHEQLQRMESKMNSMERKLKEYNLRLVGIEEKRGENCIEIVSAILDSDLQLSPNIENAYRTGRIQQHKPRHIVFKVKSTQDKFDILKQQYVKLQDKHYSIREDLTKSDYIKKQAYGPQINNAIKEGKKWRYRSGILYIEGTKVMLNTSVHNDQPVTDATLVSTLVEQHSPHTSLTATITDVHVHAVPSASEVLMSHETNQSADPVETPHQAGVHSVDKASDSEEQTLCDDKSESDADEEEMEVSESKEMKSLCTPTNAQQSRPLTTPTMPVQSEALLESSTCNSDQQPSNDNTIQQPTSNMEQSSQQPAQQETSDNCNTDQSSYMCPTTQQAQSSPHYDVSAVSPQPFVNTSPQLPFFPPSTPQHMQSTYSDPGNQQQPYSTSSDIAAQQQQPSQLSYVSPPSYQEPSSYYNKHHPRSQYEHRTQQRGRPSRYGGYSDYNRNQNRSWYGRTHERLDGYP